MKRFHVHVAVEDLAQSMRFYSSLFAAEPTVVKDDYAKWMLDDPRVNFAISQRGQKPGVNHLGLQVESDASEETCAKSTPGLSPPNGASVGADRASCCYARSDKHWITDPKALPGKPSIPRRRASVYGEDSQLSPQSTACCVPATGKLAPDAVVACGARPG